MEVTTSRAYFARELSAHWGRGGPVISELAERCADGADQSVLLGLAREVLEVTEFAPSFSDEPELLRRLHEALAIVEADIRAS
jgi:hypothetical protein